MATTPASTPSSTCGSLELRCWSSVDQPVHLPDTTAVELHRAPSRPWVVNMIEGGAWLMPDVEQPGVPLQVGTALSTGSIIALDPGAAVRLSTGPDHMILSGGARGRAHSFVA